mmetsp:Transcript_22393/g.52305  ORF Transcript_22393/g.52305 Transcript_22393/m.52305 type:complete len:101 (+) Transcript_22393:177-479(+)
MDSSLQCSRKRPTQVLRGGRRVRDPVMFAAEQPPRHVAIQHMNHAINVHLGKIAEEEDLCKHLKNPDNLRGGFCWQRVETPERSTTPSKILALRIISVLQ